MWVPRDCYLYAEVTIHTSTARLRVIASIGRKQGDEIERLAESYNFVEDDLNLAQLVRRGTDRTGNIRRAQTGPSLKVGRKRA